MNVKGQDGRYSAERNPAIRCVWHTNPNTHTCYTSPGGSTNHMAIRRHFENVPMYQYSAVQYCVMSVKCRDIFPLTSYCPCSYLPEMALWRQWGSLSSLSSHVLFVVGTYIFCFFSSIRLTKTTFKLASFFSPRLQPNWSAGPFCVNRLRLFPICCPVDAGPLWK
jgi:hypothetical protein